MLGTCSSSGFLSTAEDLVIFGDGVIRGKVLRPSTLELLFRPMRTNAGESTGYALGWRIGELHGKRAVSHSGCHIGASAWLLILPEQGLVVAILTNANTSGLTGLSARLAKIFVP